MHLQLVRNATLKLEYRGKTILIDPYFAAKHTLPSYTGKSRNPLLDLPVPAEQVVADTDLVVVSHLHSDHFDSTARALLSKDIPLLCSPVDEAAVRELGFAKVIVAEDKVTWEGIDFYRTAGRHGTSQAVLGDMGEVSGFVLEAEGTPSLYWAGDTVWYEGVSDVLKTFKPEIIVVHACGAVWGDQELIVMDAEQVIKVCRSAPSATVIATHMEALDHTTVSRDALRRMTRNAGISNEQLLIPQDGERIELEAI